jgi:hypothetical protein
MKSLIKILILLGMTVAILGFLLSAFFEMPQHGLRLFLVGFGILVFAIVASNINSWVGEEGSRSNRPLAISAIGFGIIAIIQIRAVFLSFSETIEFIGIFVGGLLMLGGIVRHFFNIRGN